MLLDKLMKSCTLCLTDLRLTLFYITLLLQNVSIMQFSLVNDFVCLVLPIMGVSGWSIWIVNVTFFSFLLTKCSCCGYSMNPLKASGFTNLPILNTFTILWFHMYFHGQLYSFLIVACIDD